MKQRKSLSAIRREAWDALRNRRYWPFAGGLFVQRGIELASGVLIALVSVFLSVLVAVMILVVGGYGLDYRFFVVDLVEAFGLVGGAIVLTLYLLVAFHLILVPLLYVYSFLQWGRLRMSLAVLDGKLAFKQAFSGWGHGWHLTWVLVIKWTYLSLWWFLIVPGIVKTFSYAMTELIAVEHPDWKADACITESRRLMAGNRWRYFCLELTLVGWWLLSIVLGLFTEGFGELAVVPYLATAKAAFYRALKERA